MYNYHTLPNGIRIVHLQNNSPVTHAGVHIGVGSRDELQPSRHGMAHFIEHTLFKGTSHRKAYHIQNRIDGVGGELNAFTTKEETCVYASTLSEHLERSIELFADLLFCATFPQAEIEREREVVIEEINSYRDYPAEQIFDDFEELLYEDHPLAHNILGSQRNIRRFDTAQLLDFVATYYVPSNITIAVVGKNDFRQVVRLCTKYFADQKERAVDLQREKPIPRPTFSRTMHHRTHQAHVVVGCTSYNLYDQRRATMALLSNIVGGPAMNSLLNTAIRERHGFCYTIESQYTPLTDTGVFTIYAGVEVAAADRYIELLQRELKKICTTPINDRALRKAAKQLCTQMAISSEGGLNEMQSIGKSLLRYDHVDTLEEMQRDIANVSPHDLMQTAAETLHPDNLSYLIFQ